MVAEKYPCFLCLTLIFVELTSDIHRTLTNNQQQIITS